MNFYKHCKNDRDSRKKLFDEVKAYVMDHRKRSKESTVSEVDKKAQQQVLDMKAELKKLAKKDASATIPA
jgi:hypothetical protein